MFAPYYSRSTRNSRNARNAWSPVVIKFNRITDFTIFFTNLINVYAKFIFAQSAIATLLALKQYTIF